MAGSKCIKCNSTNFEMIKTMGVVFVQCAECGGVVGVVEDIEFKERFETIISNQQKNDIYVTREVNEIESSLDKIKKQELQIQDIADVLRTIEDNQVKLGQAINIHIQLSQAIGKILQSKK